MTAPGSTIESAWPKYPGYRIDLVPLDGVGRVHAGDRLVAESTSCLLVRESDHQDQLYFPADDVITELHPSEHRTICPFKGEASYWSIDGPDGRLDDVVWGYPDPMDEVAGLYGHVAFYADRVDVTAAVPFGGVDASGDEAESRFPVWGTAQDLVRVLDPHPMHDGVFRAPPHPDPPLGTFFEWAPKLRARNVVEGGQLLGAALVAASKARPDLSVTSASIVFAKAAHWDAPIDHRIDSRRSGRSLGVFDVQVVQDDALRASALVMSDVGGDDLIRHDVARPEVAGPLDCPRHDFGVIGRDYRVVDGAYADQDTPGPPVLHVWSRFAVEPGPQHLHRALLAQSSTHWSIAASLRPHAGVTERDAHDTVSMGPVSVSIAFHDDVDVTDWLLTETESIHAGRGSVQTQARTWDHEGRLVASSTVQAIVRAFPDPDDPATKDATSTM